MDNMAKDYSNFTRKTLEKVIGVLQMYRHVTVDKNFVRKQVKLHPYQIEAILEYLVKLGLADKFLIGDKVLYQYTGSQEVGVDVNISDRGVFEKEST